MKTEKPPIDTTELFEPLHFKLIELLKSLEPEEWNLETVAKKWRIKDVVTHMLDTKLRVLSIQRDGYFGPSPSIDRHEDLVDWLN